MSERRILDFSKYSIPDLQKAYVEMNTFKWSNICGSKPDGFDNLTDKEKYNLPIYSVCFNSIIAHLSPVQLSSAWWTIELGKSYDEWHEWYYSKGEIK